MGKDIVLQFRVTPEERTRLEELAKLEGMSLSEYIRTQILPECMDASTYNAGAAKAKDARCISITELGDTRLPKGSLGKYDSVTF